MFLRTIALVTLAIPFAIVAGFLVSIQSGGCVPVDLETGMCDEQTLYLFIFGVIGSFVSVLVLVVWLLSSIIFRIFGLNEK
jgi:hypothetical protein